MTWREYYEITSAGNRPVTCIDRGVLSRPEYPGGRDIAYLRFSRGPFATPTISAGEGIIARAGALSALMRRFTGNRPYSHMRIRKGISGVEDEIKKWLRHA